MRLTFLKRKAARPSLPANSGEAMQWKDPVAGSSGMPDPGAKNRLTTS